MCSIRPLTGLFLSALLLIGVAQAQQKRKVVLPGQRAFVVDERLSALREKPDPRAPIAQRLRRGRAVGILGTTTNREGKRYFQIAVSRNRRGWILGEALARTGQRTDAERMLTLLEETDDDFARARLARLCADEFRLASVAPRALLSMAKAAESAADRLTRDAKRRLASLEPAQGLGKRDYFLNHAGLDRYNRIGVLFEYDEAQDRVVYDGAAYRELLRRYPKSDEARIAMEKVGRR
jgi:uncharacterized protein YgiM (DUF1202 family)